MAYRRRRYGRRGRAGYRMRRRRGYGRRRLRIGYRR